MIRALCVGVTVSLVLAWPAAAGQKDAARPVAASKVGAPAPSAAARTQAQRKAAARPTAKAAKTRPAPARPSFGQLAGLHDTDDALSLRSSVALVVDKETDEVVFSKNPGAVLPIASITKLMTALVVTDAALPLEEKLTVTQHDVEGTLGSRSRLKVGTELSRGEMLHLALMSSDNRAAHVLGRTYPGGLARFVETMNVKARLLGMLDTRYVEPTGLSSDNQSSAQDLARLVRAASTHPLIREYSTTPEASVPVGPRQVQFRNSNGLVRHPEWDILLQKTGYISAAGRCVVMQAQLAGRQFIMVLLDSAGKYSRIADAERIRRWLAESRLLPGGASEGALPAVAGPAAAAAAAATAATAATAVTAATAAIAADAQPR
jgi:D-alanyl-D-alanine endopeptidase (penicillin-binding protein 7)